MDQGWAWLVCGGKLFIWNFKESASSAQAAGSRRLFSRCFDLRIPQSGLVHRADLADVFFLPLNSTARATTVPAALIVSPEGIIRFWSNIANERYTESVVSEIQSQEFCSLTPLSQLDYLLGTTTGSVFLLTIDLNAHDPKSVIVCSPLATSSGLLHGISRRVSNLFFGPISTDSGTDMKRPLIAVPKYSQSTIEKFGSSKRPFFVMNSNFKLRQWSRANDGVNGINNLIREWDLQRSVQQKLSEVLGDGINYWPIDLITTKANELLFMIVTHDPTRDNTIRYATCVFNPYQAGDTLTSLTILRSHSWRYTNESEEQLLSLRFLERRLRGPTCFVYDRKFLFLVNIDQDIIDAIDYGIQSDGVLGAGIIDDHPILFTQRDGLIYVASAVNNQSRLNDTSIQLENQPHNSTTMSSIGSNNSFLQTTILHNSRIEPMIVELENEDDEADGDENHTSQTKTSIVQDRSVRHQQPKVEPNQSTSSNLQKSILNQSTLEKSMNTSVKPEPKVNVIQDILLRSPEFEWCGLIDERNYSRASEVLTRLAEDSDNNEILKGRKETLMALSKIAKLVQ